MAEQPWQVLDRRIVYASDWMDMQRVDLRLPDASIARDIHFVDYKFGASGAVVRREDDSILLVDHYRFQTDTRGWEIPAGKIDAGETPEQAMARELMEETGYRAQTFKYLGYYFPSNGSSNQKFHVFVARGATRVRDIEDTNEVLGVRAFMPAEVRGMIARNEIHDGLSLTALCWAITQGEFE